MHSFVAIDTSRVSPTSMLKVKPLRQYGREEKKFFFGVNIKICTLKYVTYQSFVKWKDIERTLLIIQCLTYTVM